MAVRGLFFDAVGGDRSYTSGDFETVLAAILDAGVVPGLLNGMVVAQATPAAMTVTVDTGKAFINGKLVENTSLLTLAIGANASGNPRIDRVVARVNYTTRVGEIVVKAGTPAGSPSAPALQRDASIYEISLARVAVANGAASIVTANITDERSDTSVAGYATLREQVDHAKALNVATGDQHTQYLNNARHDLTARHGSGVVDHGSIAGLGDDDHTQYFNSARLTAAVINALGLDHGSLTGLADADDHLQYSRGKLLLLGQTGFTFTGAQVLNSAAATVAANRTIRIAAFCRYFKTAGTVSAVDFGARIDGNLYNTNTSVLDSTTAVGIWVEGYATNLSPGSHTFSSILTIFGGATVATQASGNMGLLVEDIGPA